MRIGVIDIGASTTRLLLADVDGAGRSRQVLRRRHSLSPGRSDARLVETLVTGEAAHARRGGADDLVVAARASLRGTQHARMLDRLCLRLGAGRLRILGPREKADLAFAGAAAGNPSDESLAVVTVGLSSTEVAVGHPRSGPEWRGSRPVGIWRLTEGARFEDPPTAAQVGAARAAAERGLSNLHPPRADRAVLADGRIALALRRLCEDRLDDASLEQAARRIFSAPGGVLAAEIGLSPEHVRPLPAALAIAAASSELLGRPLEWAPGGILEGLVIERERELTKVGRPV